MTFENDVGLLYVPYGFLGVYKAQQPPFGKSLIQGVAGLFRRYHNRARIRRGLCRRHLPAPLHTSHRVRCLSRSNSAKFVQPTPQTKLLYGTLESPVFVRWMMPTVGRPIKGEASVRPKPATLYTAKP